MKRIYYSIIRNYYLIFRRTDLLYITFSDDKCFTYGDTMVYDKKYKYLLCVGNNYFIVKNRPR